MNIKFEEEVQGLWLLGTLSDSWEMFKTSLSNSAPYGTMNMDLVKSCVLNEEIRRKSQGSSSQSDVLVIEKMEMSKSRGPKNRDRSKSKTNKFVNVECHYCHLKRHIRKYCHQLKRDMKQGKVKDKKNDNGETSWVIDSGASILVIPRKDFFTSYTSSDFGSVRMDNDGSAKAIGMRDVRLETSNGTVLILTNVKHIPDIRMNLISTGREPESYEEAMGDENKMNRVDVMQDEMKVKQEEHTLQSRYKARLVVKGFSQKKASLDLEIEQMDVKTAFLYGDLDKEIYMEQLEGFTIKEKRIINVSRIDKLKKQLSKSLSMKDLVLAKKILGIRIERNGTSKKLYMSLEQYIEKVLEIFNMSKAKVVSFPLASHFKLSSRHNSYTDKEKEDMRRVSYASAEDYIGRQIKWIMRYLQCTSKLKLTFGSRKLVFVGYTNSDMAEDVDNRRSTSGYLMTFSRSAVSWQSRLQKCVALSTTDVKYIAAAETCIELLWMKRFVHKLGFKQQRYVVYYDNQSTIYLRKNSTFHARLKHIDVRYHWMRNALNDNLFELEKIHTDHNNSDMLTKSLPREKLEVCSIVEMASPST
ncbi:Retrovirus-related Pol polyprotein from transposon TNT 1-94 [Vitis vinifera]|uniref:Retrovirus-related Pol polyprotein from transposon TNT 1-94 n=1 Tax=Vitis vinifera TaxID=29760 RepID=A0A438E4B7_VITVI|nr:Retrovirus-related Pol polyprotein from transposon TNT 1-94 [Vitis vinifera]